MKRHIVQEAIEAQRAVEALAETTNKIVDAVRVAAKAAENAKEKARTAVSKAKAAARKNKGVKTKSLSTRKYNAIYD